MIPRIVHRVWLGAEPMPPVLEYYEQSWRRHHPGWDIRLWRDETLPPLACQALYELATGFKTKYDIVRLELLRQLGGVIVDMDVEAVRPLDPLLQGVHAFAGRLGRTHIGNQVLGAVPRHPFFERAVARLDATVGVARTSSKAAGKSLLETVLAEAPEAVTLFPPETFYYQPSFDPPKRPDDFPHVYAVHHELATYVSPLPPGTLQLRLARLAREVDSLPVAPGVGDGGAARERVLRAERRLRDAIEQHEQWYRTHLHQVAAEREQVAARQRDLEARLTELERGGLSRR
jgi:hypothetical protein